ncbi:MAG: alpha-galactosidase [Candidatus Hydrogenedentes bacterium]|nr:alpha-galactosidase [Candidatus Hydrogenedentota bacterium]
MLSFKSSLLTFALAVSILSASAVAVEPNESELTRVREWTAAHLAQGAAAPPYAFQLDTASSNSFLPGWNHAPLPAAPQGWTGHTSAAPSGGMQVTHEYLLHPNLPAVEWRLHFKNTGSADSGILTDVNAADFVIDQWPMADMTLHYADGSQATPTDFQPRDSALPGKLPLRFAPEGGRSSDGVMPYFNFASKSGGGMIVAIGWSGQWQAGFSDDGSGHLRIQAGMARTHLRLHPGEQIRTPAILIMFYDGDWLRGQNLWRRLMLDHYSPTFNGKRVALPLAASGATLGFNLVAESNQIAAIENVAANALPVDTWWMDAGWSLGGFPEGMGTWTPDPARFPNGLKPIGDAAHAKGLKFLLWFEPERVMPGTALRRDHPEWLLAPAGLPEPVAYQKRWRLLDLGNPEALAWAINTFSGMAGEYGVDIYRHDFNMHPLYYWQNNEPQDRQGMREIKYIEGLYAYFDGLRANHPGILLDNCASGGRRLDFEMMRRSVPLWRSDYCWEPTGAQNIHYGLSLWLPQHGLGAVSTAPFDLQSGLGTNVSFAFDYYTADAPFWKPLDDAIETYQRLRHCFEGDFYPLTPWRAEQDCWLAWQYSRPDLDEGIVQAFRREKNTEQSIQVVLKGLNANARYAVTRETRGEVTKYSGAELQTAGLSIPCEEAPGAVLLHYQRLSE